MQHGTLQSALVTALLLVTRTSAHFLLNYPNTVGFSDDNEGTAPCGGFNVTFDNATSFHVDGDAIAVTSTHPQAEWLFRATLDKTGTGDNFTDLLPVVSEAGLGSYCEPGLTVPGTWAGSDGVIQVIQHGPDGSLFQCAAINFVGGKATSIPSSCKNATGLTASFTSDAGFLATPAATVGPSDSMTMSGSTSPSTTPAPSASSTKSAATSVHQYAASSSLWWLGSAIVGVGTSIGFLYL